MVRKAERTIYLVQRVTSGEQTIWQPGKPPRQENLSHYETLHTTESRSEALAVCKYELKRLGKPCRIITRAAWLAQGNPDYDEQRKGADRGGISRPRVRTARSARATPPALDLPMKTYQPSGFLAKLRGVFS